MSSILIKGMEMPTTCAKCPLGHINAKRYALECYADYPTKLFDYDLARHSTNPFCPLVPVPPHGDLIDRREAIIDANERAYDFWLSDDEVNATIQFLNEQTTIIPAEEGE